MQDWKALSSKETVVFLFSGGQKSDNDLLALIAPHFLSESFLLE